MFCALTYINATVAPGAHGARPRARDARLRACASGRAGTRRWTPRPCVAPRSSPAADAAPVRRARSPRGDPGREREAGDLPASWATNDSMRPAVDWHAYPLDIVVVERPRRRAVVRRRPGHGDDAGTASCRSCASALVTIARDRVRDERRHAVPRPARDAGARRCAAKTDSPRHGRRRRRLRRPGVPRRSPPCTRWRGPSGTTGCRRTRRRRPAGAACGYAVLSPRPAWTSPFALYVGMYNVEPAVVPAVADAARRCAGACLAPPSGAPVRRHAGGPQVSLRLRSRRTPTAASPPWAETVAWASRGVRPVRFAVTSLGSPRHQPRPCILFQRATRCGDLGPRELRARAPPQRSRCSRAARRLHRPYRLSARAARAARARAGGPGGCSSRLRRVAHAHARRTAVDEHGRLALDRDRRGGVCRRARRRRGRPSRRRCPRRQPSRPKPTASTAPSRASVPLAGVSGSR